MAAAAASDPSFHRASFLFSLSRRSIGPPSFHSDHSIPFHSISLSLSLSLSLMASEEIMHREVITEDEVVVDAAASPATRTETDGEQSSVDDETEVGDDPRGFTTAGGLMGRHRLSAAVSRLEQEILSLQEELEEVEGQLRPSSAACEQLANRVASVPDALLPVTCGPKDVAWDRWFQRVHGDKGESSRSGGGDHRRGLGRRWWMQGRRFLPSSSGEGRVEALAE